MYNIYSIVILILFDLPRFSVNDLHQIQVAAPRLTTKTLDYTRNGMFTHFEHMDCTVISNDVDVKLCIVYRPPPSKRNGFKNNLLFDEWSLYLDRLAVITNDVIITGDLNFHLDNDNDADAVRFNGTLEAHGLIQHVVEPHTRRAILWMLSSHGTLVMFVDWDANSF